MLSALNSNGIAIAKITPGCGRHGGFTITSATCWCKHSSSRPASRRACRPWRRYRRWRRPWPCRLPDSSRAGKSLYLDRNELRPMSGGAGAGRADTLGTSASSTPASRGRTPRATSSPKPPHELATSIRSLGPAPIWTNRNGFWPTRTAYRSRRSTSACPAQFPSPATGTAAARPRSACSSTACGSSISTATAFGTRSDLWIKLGKKGDQPVAGDWNGDGKTDIGIFGPAWIGDCKAGRGEPGLPDAQNPPARAGRRTCRPMPPTPRSAIEP